MLARALARRVEIPHEPGEWMDLRGLNWVQLQEARNVQTAAAIRSMRELGPELIQSAQAVRASAANAAVAPPADPLEGYDQATILRFGVAAWSYAEPVTVETLADLDEATATWAARAVIGLQARPEGDRKNGS